VAWFEQKQPPEIDKMRNPRASGGSVIQIGGGVEMQFSGGVTMQIRGGSPMLGGGGFAAHTQEAGMDAANRIRLGLKICAVRRCMDHSVIHAQTNFTLRLDAA
jgi:hypothetical protein